MYATHHEARYAIHACTLRALRNMRRSHSCLRLRATRFTLHARPRVAISFFVLLSFFGRPLCPRQPLNKTGTSGRFRPISKKYESYEVTFISWGRKNTVDNTRSVWYDGFVFGAMRPFRMVCRALKTQMFCTYARCVRSVPSAYAMSGREMQCPIHICDSVQTTQEGFALQCNANVLAKEFKICEL